jgi:acetoin utilization protein AcuB
MIVGMWMTRDLVTIEPQTRLADVALLMSRHKIRRLPVVGAEREASRLQGIISATDLYRAYPLDRNPFAPGALEGLSSDLTAEQIMTRSPVTTTADAPVEDAAALMRDRKIGALPVLHGENLVGLITESDIFRAFLGILGDHSGGARVTFKTSEDEDVFGLLAEAARGRKVRVVSLISSRQEGYVLSTVRLTGQDVETLLDQVWAAGHQPLNILRWA